jgi:murein DD-endopeptidase MepM/ murein hydrolase activator NlpD
MERTSTHRNIWTERHASTTRLKVINRSRKPPWARKRLLHVRWITAAAVCCVAALLVPALLNPGVLAPAGLEMLMAPAAVPEPDTQEYLYYPREWPRILAIDSLTEAAGQSAQLLSAGAGGHGGGMDVAPMVLDIKQYRVRRGDTMSGIAHQFGLSLDTVASLNRTAGMGVHRLDIGELIKVPNQDGIYIAVTDLDAQSQEHGVLPDAVLRTNNITRDMLSASVELFFPGVQHSGRELSLATGTAFQRPARAGWVSSRFGPRKDPFGGGWRQHRGVDIAAPHGTRVYSVQDGRVAAVGSNGVLGKYIIVSHFAGYSSLYAHLSRIFVSRGEGVSGGETIGAIGSTGRSTGPHLHFELRRGQLHLNPADFIPGLR